MSHRAGEVTYLSHLALSHCGLNIATNKETRGGVVSEFRGKSTNIKPGTCTQGEGGGCSINMTPYQLGRDAWRIAEDV